MNNTVKIKNLDTKMIAHRGLSALEVENTAAAFVAAGNRSYYGIECDIRRTADGKYAVHHDSTLKRLSGVDIAPKDATLEELQKIHLPDLDGAVTRADLCTARLEDYISICKKYGKHCILELKGEYTDGETKSFIDIIDSLGYLESVTFISFNYDNLLKVRKFLPNQSAQFLFEDFTEEIIERLVKDGIDVDVYHGSLTKEIIDRLHSLGLVINCWTVDDRERAELLAKWGVDQITSDVLEGDLPEEKIIDAIKKRRSIKRYKSDAVPRELIDEVIAAGISAASGRNLQCPIVLAITDKATRDRLSAANAAVLGMERDPFYSAPAVLVVLFPKSCRTGIYDGSLVMGNMMLAADALGLGSCWIHRAREVFEEPEWKELLRSLGLEGEYEGVGNLILGYPDCEYPAPIPRRDNRVFYI